MSATMEIRVKCGCGSILSFREEPVNGRVRWPVACTTCGADATDQANAFLARCKEPEVGLRQAPQKGFGWLKRRKDEAVAPDEPGGMNDGSFGKEPTEVVRPSAGRLALGILACLATGTVAMLGWYLLTRWTGYEFGIIAWGIGGLVGVCARYCVPSGSFRLAGVAAGCAAAAILGGAALTLRHESLRYVEALLPAAYEDVRDYAESALKLSSVEETREFIAKHRLGAHGGTAAASDPIEAAQQRHLLWASWTLHGIVKPREDSKVRLSELVKPVDPETITPAEIATFREQEVPALEAFLAGQPSQHEFESSLRGKILSRMSSKDLVLESFGPYTVLWLFLGIGTAFKLAHNKGLSY